MVYLVEREGINNFLGWEYSKWWSDEDVTGNQDTKVIITTVSSLSLSYKKVDNEWMDVIMMWEEQEKRREGSKKEQMDVGKGRWREKDEVSVTWV